MLNRRRFDKMYKAYADDIFRYLLVHLRDVQLAEDLTADTFLKAWKKIKTFDNRHPRAWLYAIARNNMNDYWRKNKTVNLDDEYEIIDDRPDQDETLDKQLDAERMKSAILNLPKDMKSVVTLRFLQGYSVKQTSDALDLSEANVRVIQYRALKKLRGDLS